MPHYQQETQMVDSEVGKCRLNKQSTDMHFAGRQASKTEESWRRLIGHLPLQDRSVLSDILSCPQQEAANCYHRSIQAPLVSFPQLNSLCSQSHKLHLVVPSSPSIHSFPPFPSSLIYKKGKSECFKRQKRDKLN